ncbi:hypothetical protein [Arthrobacter crystallopoietes]|uniref:hypothetical protein n=1 Tax=Crystallibacter crystallopoietes TaxID=37928 RepID=UPI001ABE858E|nr:hypothetical protein [Arthrobacter crystallopoietes]QTG79439.1 hypothetical protein J5251_10780 [Arthrobacter crystallopoietes]
MTVPDAVIVQQSEWWNVLEALGPLATLLAAAVAGFIAWQALKERALADRRAEWWSRAQWALDASLSADMERKATGLGVLALLAKSHLATDEEIEILATAAIRPLQEAALPAALPQRASEDHCVKTNAARLCVTTDRRLGRATPQWVSDLAASGFPQPGAGSGK